MTYAISLAIKPLIVIALVFLLAKFRGYLHRNLPKGRLRAILLSSVSGRQNVKDL